MLKNAVRLNQLIFEKYEKYKDVLSKIKVLEMKKN